MYRYLHALHRDREKSILQTTRRRRKSLALGAMLPEERRFSMRFQSLIPEKGTHV